MVVIQENENLFPPIFASAPDRDFDPCQGYPGKAFSSGTYTYFT